MPTYLMNGKRIRRKNLYLPCALAQNIEGMTEEQRAEIYKANKWCDRITNNEWELILNQHPKSEAVIRSQLTNKMVEWLIMLGRISIGQPHLFNTAIEKAKKKYKETFGEENPILK